MERDVTKKSGPDCAFQGDGARGSPNIIPSLGNLRTVPHFKCASETFTKVHSAARHSHVLQTVLAVAPGFLPPPPFSSMFQG